MRLPIRNYIASPITLFIEPQCDQYEIPPCGEAIVTLEEGRPHSIDLHPEHWVSLWDEGSSDAQVEIITEKQQAVIQAISFVRAWLHQYRPSGSDAVEELNDAIEREEKVCGYLRARFVVYQALRQGFLEKAAEDSPNSAALPVWDGRENLAGAYRAGGVAAYANYQARLDPKLFELGKAPFDTDVARVKFGAADALII